MSTTVQRDEAHATDVQGAHTSLWSWLTILSFGAFNSTFETCYSEFTPTGPDAR